jgi:hypothetical protein
VQTGAEQPPEFRLQARKATLEVQQDSFPFYENIISKSGEVKNENFCAKEPANRPALYKNLSP